jgi:hypothetical protein
MLAADSLVIMYMQYTIAPYAGCLSVQRDNKAQGAAVAA